MLIDRVNGKKSTANKWENLSGTKERESKWEMKISKL